VSWPALRVFVVEREMVDSSIPTESGTKAEENWPPIDLRSLPWACEPLQGFVTIKVNANLAGVDKEIECGLTP
jgi:hypothetical protein